MCTAIQIEEMQIAVDEHDGRVLVEEANVARAPIQLHRANETQRIAAGRARIDQEDLDLVLATR